MSAYNGVAMNCTCKENIEILILNDVILLINSMHAYWPILYGKHSVSYFTAASLFGDPHIVSLDGNAYTFNGAGEYVIVDALNKSYLIQARTELAERTDGGQPVGSVFTAIAARTNISDTVEVQRSYLRGVNILVNGERLAVDEPREWPFVGVSVTYEGDNGVLVRFNSGESLHVRVQSNILRIEIAGFPIAFWNQTKGLLGNWNGNPNDDFLLPNGQVLPTSISMQEIHYLFGEKCEYRACTGDRSPGIKRWDRKEERKTREMYNMERSIPRRGRLDRGIGGPVQGRGCGGSKMSGGERGIGSYLLKL